MGRWFNDREWDHELDRNTERYLNEQEYWERFNDMDPIINDPSIDLIEGLSAIVNIMFAIRLINKLVIRKDFTINREEIMYLGTLVIRIMLPELNILLIFWSYIKFKSYLERKNELT